MISSSSMRAAGALLLLGAAAATRAGQVSIPNAFTAGTPARAGEVNANFSAIAAEVNDNDARIDGLTTRADGTDAALSGKQNRVSGTCPAGSSIRTILSDGTVTCENDDAGSAYVGAAPITVTAQSIGLASGGITDAHVSATAAIAVSKISGDTGAEFNPTFWSLNPVSTTTTSIGSITVSAPGAGVILLFMNGEAHNTGTNFLHVVGIGTSASAFSIERALTPMSNTQTFGVMWATTASAAGTYTFHALARKVDPTACCTAWLSDVNLLGIFIPKRY